MPATACSPPRRCPCLFSRSRIFADLSRTSSRNCSYVSVGTVDFHSKSDCMRPGRIASKSDFFTWSSDLAPPTASYSSRTVSNSAMPFGMPSKSLMTFIWTI